MSSFTINKDIPLPSAGHRAAIYPFAEMEVGDSFDAPRDLGKTKRGGDKRQAAIVSYANFYTKSHNHAAKFATRLIDENTVRCWRVA